MAVAAAVLYTHAVPAKAQDEVLKVGLLATMSGGGAAWGIGACRGWQMAAEDINSKGGIAVGDKKYMFEPLCEDDKVNTAEAMAAANKLFSKDGVTYMGLFSSVSTLAGTTLTNEKKMLSMSAAGMRQALGPDKPYNFRMYMTHVEIGRMFWDWVKQNKPEIKRVAILARDDAAGQSIGNDLAKIITDAGFEVVAVEFTGVNASDYYPVLTKVLALKPDAIEVGTVLPSGVGLVAKQTVELGWKGPLFATTEQALTEALKVGGADNIVGRFFGTTPEYGGALATEAEKAMSARYGEAYKNEPLTAMTTMAYNGLSIIAQAIEGAGTLDSEALTGWLQDHPVETIHGESRFGGKSLYGVPNQLYTPVWISEATEGGWKAITKTPATPVE
ncbi:MAG: amino acid ABC transporter substrate-binding protein [Alphaproteobacteria bacterium]|nr:MAG: amino acid ABC transporter substrate-binding protein [Alphaproteobacteria bacterium]